MIDIILLVVLLVAAIYGFRSGLLRSLIGILGNILALIISYFSARPLAGLLEVQFQFATKMASSFRDVLPIPVDLTNTLASLDGMAKVYEYLESAPLPRSMKDTILQAMQEQVDAVGQGVFATMADIVANSVAETVLQGLTFIGLWILLCLLLTICGKWFAGVIHHIPIVGTIDRLCGMILTFGVAAATIALLYSGVELLGLFAGSPLEDSVVLQTISAIRNEVL